MRKIGGWDLSHVAIDRVAEEIPSPMSLRLGQRTGTGISRFQSFFIVNPSRAFDKLK